MLKEEYPSIGIVYDVAYPFIEGGGQRRFFEVGRRLSRRGWKIDWYCFKTWEGESIRSYEGITYYGLSGYSTLYTKKGRRSIKEALSFGQAILTQGNKFHKYSILWLGQWPYFHIFAVWVRNLKRTSPIIIDWWETWNKHWYEYLGIAGIFGRVIERLASRVGDYKICITNKGRDEIEKIGANAKSLRIIHNGIDFKEIASVLPSSEKCDLIYLGRLKNHKNVDHLVKIVAILKKSGKDVLAHVLGDGPEKERLVNLAEELNVREKITFFGYIASNTEAYQHLKAATLFVNPSTKEGGGSITLFEANACGLPVIAYKHPLGIDPTLIDENKNGRLVTDISPEALANEIDKLLSSPSQLKLLKQRSIEMSKNYDWDIITEQYEQLFINHIDATNNRSRAV